MPTRGLMVILAASCVSMAHGTLAQADLGNCFVLRGAGKALDGDDFHECEQAIYQAYSHSDVSDQDIIFVLTLNKYMDGAYRINSIKLSYAEEPPRPHSPWTGFQISAPNMEGLKLAVAEIVKAYGANVLHRLKDGHRADAVEKPVLKD